MKISDTLRGGDPRSLGRTQEVVDLILEDQDDLDDLFECLFDEDEIVRMRASDALEKICRVRPEWIKPYVSRLLNEASKIKQPSVQWHLAQMFTELPLDDDQEDQALEIMQTNLKTMDEWVVTNLTLESLASFVRKGAFPANKFIPLLKHHQTSRHKSVAARVQKLLKEFEA